MVQPLVARTTDAAQLSDRPPGKRAATGGDRGASPREGERRRGTGRTQPAPAASRTRGTCLAAQSPRLLGSRGKKKAIVALGPTILTIAYPLLTRTTDYQELG